MDFGRWRFVHFDDETMTIHALALSDTQRVPLQEGNALRGFFRKRPCGRVCRGRPAPDRSMKRMFRIIVSAWLKSSLVLLSLLTSSG